MFTLFANFFKTKFFVYFQFSFILNFKLNSQEFLVMAICFKFIILFLISYTAALKISCTYNNFDWNEWGLRKNCDASFDAITRFSPTVTGFQPGSSFCRSLDAIRAVTINAQKIHYLPQGLTRIFQNMKEFYIFKCELTHLSRSDLKSYTQLETVSFSENLLAKIPYDTFEDMVNLEYFSLSHNKLTKVPNLRTMKKLKELYLHENKIHLFTANDFSENTSLEVIWMQHNRLTVIDRMIFEWLPALSYIDLTHNKCIDAKYPETRKTELENIIKSNC